MLNKYRNTIFSLLLIVVAMFCLAYASVPIYRIFCKVTGYAGTVKERNISNDVIGNKRIKIRFNADLHSDLPWKFYPKFSHVIARTGEQKLAFYYAENLSNTSIDAMAVYNVTPHSAGKYFNKIACFCFSKQTLSPYAKVVMPVTFSIDPEIENDPETANIDVITLSYTFFKYKK